MRKCLAGVAGVFVLLAGTPAEADVSEASKSLAICQRTVARESAAYAKGVETAISTCLQKVASELTRKGAAGSAETAVGTCTTQWRNIYDTRGIGKSLSERFRAAVRGKCDPQTHAHSLGDILGPGATVDEPIDAESLGSWCANFGGDGTVTSVDAWLSCIEEAHDCEARQAVATRFPRVLVYLDLLHDLMAAQSSPAADPSRVSDAVAGLELTLASLDANADFELDPGCAGFEGVVCAAGEYRVPGASACKPCDPGTYSPVAGATECLACKPGTASSVSGAASCETCVAGSYQDQPGQLYCSSCATGSFADRAGLDSCKLCPAGTYSAATSGAVDCTPCAAGFFASVPGRASCEACPPGRFAAGEGRSACIACDPGTFSATYGASECQRCSAGFITDTAGRDSCQPCDPGEFAAVDGRNACTPCPAGSHAPSSGASACQPCTAGTAQPLEGANSCASCDAGNYQDHSGSIACQPCPAGTAQPQQGQVSCQPCTGGTFSTDAGQSACSSCTGYRYSNGRACVDCPSLGVTCADGLITSEDNYFIFTNANGYD